MRNTDIDITTKNKPLEFFKIRQKGNTIRLSKSIHGNTILTLSNRLLHLSHNGKVMKATYFPFDVCDALESDERHYVVCTGVEVCIVNDFGEKTLAYSPSDESQTIKAPHRLAKDSRGNIYVFDGNPESLKIFVLDHKLDFISFHNINHSVCKMCYDEANDTLVILMSDNYLTIFELWISPVFFWQFLRLIFTNNFLELSAPDDISSSTHTRIIEASKAIQPRSIILLNAATFVHLFYFLEEPDHRLPLIIRGFEHA